MPLVTVIIPNYNHGTYLRERIESVIHQTFSDIEIILIDDCSTDNSQDIIREYQQHPKVSFVFLNATNSGSPYSHWPMALQLANAGWIWVAESDDLSDPQFLEKLYPLALQDPRNSLVYCDSVILENTGIDTPKLYSSIKNNRYGTAKWSQPYQQDGKQELNEFLKKDCTINNVSAVLFRKAFAMDVVKTFSGFRFHGDWIFYIRMAEKGRITYLPEALNQYREHAGNHSKIVRGDHFNKPECFHILQYLLQQDYITGKKELTRHFIREYIGFGLWKDQPFSKRGIFRTYWEKDWKLSLRVLFRLIINKITPG